MPPPAPLPAAGCHAHRAGECLGNPSALCPPRPAGPQAGGGRPPHGSARTARRAPAEIRTQQRHRDPTYRLVTGAALELPQANRHIISTQIEHHAVLHTLQALQAQGFTMAHLPPRRRQTITPQQLADALQPDTCLVSIMFANNEIGTVQPIAELGASAGSAACCSTLTLYRLRAPIALICRPRTLTCSAFPATSSTGREPVRYIPSAVLPCRMCCTAAARSAATARALRTYASRTPRAALAQAGCQPARQHSPLSGFAPAPDGAAAQRSRHPHRR